MCKEIKTQEVDWVKFGQKEIKDLNSDYLTLEIMCNHFIPHCLWAWAPITEEPTSWTHLFYELEVSCNFTKTLNSGNLSYFNLTLNALLNKNNIALFFNSMYFLKWKSLCRVQHFDTVHGILQTRILESVAFSFSRGSSQPSDQTQISCIAGRFLTSWATREGQEHWSG